MINSGLPFKDLVLVWIISIVLGGAIIVLVKGI